MAKGFNLTGLPAVEDGHFGITGMRERANSIGADFKIQSNGNGTIDLFDRTPSQTASILEVGKLVDAAVQDLDEAQPLWMIRRGWRPCPHQFAC